ncbi:MAG: dihydrolipoyl dehydrogenase [Prevotella sp.]
MDNRTDLIIIGGGPGGYHAAIHAAKAGLRVTLIERAHLGGTCLNMGCIPTKTLAHTAELMHHIQHSAPLGIDCAAPAVNLPQVMAHKEEVIGQLREGIASLMTASKVEVVQGEACFVDNHTVEVNGNTFTAPSLIIATGSVPKMLPLQQADASMLLDSTDILSLTALPSHLCIVGAGVIGMELACIFHSFGCQVTVIEFLKECLPALDSDIAKRLRKTLEKRGIGFVMQAAVKSVADGFVTYERKGKEERIAADKVLMAVGRAAGTASLHLERTGIVYSPKGIATDDHMQTNIEGVYAIGDVNGRQMLAHAASAQAEVAVHHILTGMRHVEGAASLLPRLEVMPAAIFTSPEAACVGMTEESCKAAGIDCGCGKAFHRANGKALSMNETEGMLKIIYDKTAGTLLGCHAFGAHSADMVQEVAALMCRHTTIEQLASIIHIHPTLGELVLDAAKVTGLNYLVQQG